VDLETYVVRGVNVGVKREMSVWNGLFFSLWERLSAAILNDKVPF
jgi:hypothetical protein